MKISIKFLVVYGWIFSFHSCSKLNTINCKNGMNSSRKKYLSQSNNHEKWDVLVNNHVNELAESIFVSLKKRWLFPMELCSLIVSFSDPCRVVLRKVRNTYQRNPDEWKDVDKMYGQEGYCQTPLMEAVDNNRFQHVKWMVDFHFLDLQTTDPFGLNPLCLSIAKGATKITKLLIDAGSKVNGVFRSVHVKVVVIYFLLWRWVISQQ